MQLDWVALFKRYVADDIKTPYFVAVGRLTRLQAAELGDAGQVRRALVVPDVTLEELLPVQFHRSDSGLLFAAGARLLRRGGK